MKWALGVLIALGVLHVIQIELLARGVRFTLDRVDALEERLNSLNEPREPIDD